jgi:epoxyqueuosine reductase
MDLENQLHDAALDWGADYFGIADLTPACDTILAQGGSLVADYPRSLSIGVALLHPVVDLLASRTERAAAISYRFHHYELINPRLDQIISRLGSVLQHKGYRAFPVPASKRVDNDRICAIFSHKLSAHLAGLGWIGKNSLLITPDMGPRVRWATLLTDAPLNATGPTLGDGCGDCRECVDVCPVRALTGQPFRAAEAREARIKAATCDRYFARMREKDAETAVCGMCLYVCPYGQRQNGPRP